MERKGKRSTITEDNEGEIRFYALKTTTQRTDLAEQLQNIIKWEGKPPEIEVLERKISKYRVINRGGSDPIDEPFSLDCLSNADYEIPPDARPTVMAAYKKRLLEGDVLPIREALWIGRLYKIVEPPELILDWAFLYTFHEMVSEKIGKKPFDSRKLDLMLLRNPEHARETKRAIDIWEIAEKYDADPVKLKDLNLSIEETEEAAKSGKYKKEGDSL